MKKINSLIRSSVEVFRLSKPLLLASVSPDFVIAYPKNLRQRV